MCHTVTQEAKYKCDIYMVFDYAEHDLTGLMDATRHAALRPDQVGSAGRCMEALQLPSVCQQHRSWAAAASVTGAQMQQEQQALRPGQVANAGVHAGT